MSAEAHDAASPAASPVVHPTARRLTRDDLTAQVERLVGPLGAPALLDLDQVHAVATALLAAAGAPADAAADFTANTLRYYRRMGVVTPPDGQTVSARYGRRQVLEAAVARLSGHGSQGTIASMAALLPTLGDMALISLLAVRLTDAQIKASVPATEAHQTGHEAPETPMAPLALRASMAPSSIAPSSAAPSAASSSGAGAPWTVALPGGAFCVFPAGHAMLDDRDREGTIAAVLTALRTALAERAASRNPARPLPR